MKRLIIALAASTAALAVPASAAIVCNEDGDCWRVKERYEYRPEFKVRVYEDSWKWRDDENAKYRWRESRPNRGYYGKGGVWIDF